MALTGVARSLILGKPSTISAVPSPVGRFPLVLRMADLFPLLSRVSRNVDAEKLRA